MWIFYRVLFYEYFMSIRWWKYVKRMITYLLTNIVSKVHKWNTDFAFTFFAGAKQKPYKYRYVGA